MIKLSKRLQTIADRVTHGSRIADIGSDHALLPVYLVQSGKCPSAIAGELNAGPFHAALKQTAEAGLKAFIDVRQGDGLFVLAPGEADCVSIAGMGGSLMSGILQAGWSAGLMDGVSELVLQPNVGEDIVRRWLVDHSYVLQAEEILEEDGRIYEVLHATNAANHIEAAKRNEELYKADLLSLQLPPSVRREWLYRMGPYLLRRREPLLKRKWLLELDKFERICRQLEHSDLPESREKQQLIRGEMKQIEEVLACL